MKILPDFPILDFSGGVRNDRSDFQMKDNEFVKMTNFDIDRIGRLKKRRGSNQMGTTATGTIDNSVYWELAAAGVPSTFHIINNTASTANIYKISGTRLNGAITTVSTSIVTDLASATLAASGTIEIEGDIITYTGKTSETLTGVTGITFNHANHNAIHQLTALTGDSVDGRQGVYYATLNNLLFVNGRVGSSTFDGSTMTAVGDGDEPNGLFATTYRQKIYLAGSLGTTGVRTYFSNNGDGTAWTSTDWFDTEDNLGELITGYRVSRSDELLIFKTNSFFSYNEVNLKQRSKTVGAYGHKVIEEIDGLIYTFCPSGVYVTDGFESKLISEPIKDYLKDFRPTYDTTSDRVLTNAFSASHDNKYILYIGDVSSVDILSNTALIYDTQTKKWSIENGYTNLTHLNGLKSFKFANKYQRMEGLFMGTSSAKYYRMLSKSFRDSDGNNRFTTDGDLFKDMVSDTGTTVTGEIETKFFDLKTQGWLKDFGYLRVIGDGTDFHISYQIENKKGITKWKPLGKTDRLNQRFKIDSDDIGYRIKFRISHNSLVDSPVLTGLFIEEAKTMTRD